jgi:hypothetical protein
MPARFAPGARDVAAAAVAEARLRGDRRIGTEHLLLGVLRHPAAARALAVDLAAARAALGALDQEALSALGIDVGPGLDPAEPADCPWPSGPPVPGLFGRPRTAPSPAQVTTLRAALSSGARAVLARAISAAPSSPARTVTPELVLAALLAREPPDPAAALLDRLGVDRAQTLARLGNPAV